MALLSETGLLVVTGFGLLEGGGDLELGDLAGGGEPASFLIVLPFASLISDLGTGGRAVSLSGEGASS